MSQRSDVPNPPPRTGGPYAQAGLRAGTRRQYFEVGAKLLVAYTGGEGDVNPGTFQFSIRTPSAQVRTKISVNFEPAAGVAAYPNITVAGNTIWVAAADDSRGGASSTDIPNSSVEGRRGAPTPFPSTLVAGVVTIDPGLLGYSREFVSSSDYLIGEVNLPPAGIAGAWMLIVTVQPDGVVLPDDAWEEISSAYRLRVGRAPA